MNMNAKGCKGSSRSPCQPQTWPPQKPSALPSLAGRSVGLCSCSAVSLRDACMGSSHVLGSAEQVPILPGMQFAVHEEAREEGRSLSPQQEMHRTLRWDCKRICVDESRCCPGREWMWQHCGTGTSSTEKAVQAHSHPLVPGAHFIPDLDLVHPTTSGLIVCVVWLCGGAQTSGLLPWSSSSTLVSVGLLLLCSSFRETCGVGTHQQLPWFPWLLQRALLV